jgi:uncharacterized protein
MVLRKPIDDFLSQRKIAVVGVSRDTKQYANSVYRLLKERDYIVYPVNPYAKWVENDRCYPDIRSLPEQVGGVLIILPAEKTMEVLPTITQSGIKHVWIHQGTESSKAVQFCREHSLNVVYGECVIMFMEPMAFPHRLHRWIKKMTGSFPI